MPQLSEKTPDNRLAIVQEITLALNSTMDPGKLLDLLLDSCIRYTAATTGSVILVNEKSELQIVRERGLGGDASASCRLQVGQGITGWVAREGVPLNVADVASDDRYIEIKEHIRSELAVPMIRSGDVIGVISVDSRRVGNFSDEDMQILGFVGSQAAQILSNAQSFRELERRSERDETMLEISRVLGSALELESLFHSVMEILSRRERMERGCLLLIDQDIDELSIVYGHGMTPEEMARGRYQRGEGIIGRAYKTKKPISVRDIRREPKFLGKTGAFFDDSIHTSFYAVPILLEEKSVGVIGVHREFVSDEEFAEGMGLLQIVASTLSQAVKIYQAASSQRAELVRENQMLREELQTHYRFDNLIGNSSAMKRVFKTVISVAPSKSTVLIRGESGTGKELIAHAIHHNSSRVEAPFVRVNCAAIPENLLEAELFGHVKGSFTGAVADRKGRFVLADGGTIFLDEIGDMPLMLQAKILRVIQEKELEAVGAEKTTKVDVRIIAATHQPLENLVAEGKFREDLYYRLNVVPIEVPPLRDRIEDIRLLVKHFLDKLRRENDIAVMKISPNALRELARYAWPGNVRELENIIERAAIMCESDVIRTADLPDLGSSGPMKTVALRAAAGGSLSESVTMHFETELDRESEGEIWDRTMSVVERVLIRGALDRSSGVRLKAAELLGIHRNTLRKKIAELDLAVKSE